MMKLSTENSFHKLFIFENTKKKNKCIWLLGNMCKERFIQRIIYFPFIVNILILIYIRNEA